MIEREQPIVESKIVTRAPSSIVGGKWHKRFISVATLVSTWSTCKRRQCGAVIVRGKYILSSGYNGAPAGVKECTNGRECIREKRNVPSGERHELCIGAHAEQNAINQAAANGVGIRGSSIYIYGGSPCTMCAKDIIGAGIVSVYYTGDYPDELALQLLQEAGVDLYKLEQT